MNQITRIFFRGLFALLPLSFSLFVLFWFFRKLEELVDSLLFTAHPTIHALPGLGVVVGLVFIFLFGLFISSPLSRLYQWIERPFQRVPFLKTVYSAVQDLIQYFNQGSDDSAGIVVAVSPPDFGGQFIGLVTKTDVHKLAPGHFKEDLVAVFIPMSYALGGYTIFVPRKWVKHLDMTVDKAMRSALTAWMERKETPKSPSEQS